VAGQNYYIRHSAEVERLSMKYHRSGWDLSGSLSEDTARTNGPVLARILRERNVIKAFGKGGWAKLLYPSLGRSRAT